MPRTPEQKAAHRAARKQRRGRPAHGRPDPARKQERQQARRGVSNAASPAHRILPGGAALSLQAPLAQKQKRLADPRRIREDLVRPLPAAEGMQPQIRQMPAIREDGSVQAQWTQPAQQPAPQPGAPVTEAQFQPAPPATEAQLQPAPAPPVTDAQFQVGTQPATMPVVGGAANAYQLPQPQPAPAPGIPPGSQVAPAPGIPPGPQPQPAPAPGTPPGGGFQTFPGQPQPSPIFGGAAGSLAGGFTGWNPQAPQQAQKFAPNPLIGRADVLRRHMV
jgi:hypothetical protein